MIKKILLYLASKHSFIASLKHTYQQARGRYYDSLKVDDKLIVFEAFRSTKYADSPKAIYEYMMSAKEYSEYKFIWVFEDPSKYKHLENSRTKLVKHESNAHYVAFARAKYWIINGWIPLRFQKKSGQKVLQCWHGTPLKRLRYDIVNSVNTEHRSNALRDNDLDTVRFDYFISPSKFATKAFSSAFNLVKLDKEAILIETGYPRNDALMNYKPSEVKDIKKRLGIPMDKKVILYAPTWRDDQNVEGGGYEYHLPIDFEYLKDSLSSDYVILFRAHNLVANSFNFNAHKGFIYDVSREDDINELYIISDVLMTDYSSVFFDYANLKRPIIFYMYDKNHYEKDLRGFYLDIDELPGDVVETETAVVDSLKSIEEHKNTYNNRYKEFSDKFNYLDDGKATQRVVEKVIEK